MTTRREFLARTGLAIAGGLIVGDAALALFERLTHRKVWALGEVPRLMALSIGTAAKAGTFSIFAKPGDGFTGFSSVLINGQPADGIQRLGRGWVRAHRCLGPGHPEPGKLFVMAVGAPSLKNVQLEDGEWPHVSTGVKLAEAVN